MIWHFNGSSINKSIFNGVPWMSFEKKFRIKRGILLPQKIGGQGSSACMIYWTEL
jgi:hypothetical protein